MNPDFKPRLYQEIILQTAAKRNTMVVLPTGLGKTAIAAMLISHRFSNYPNSKAVFLAPTKPLAQQHEKTLKKLLPDFAESVTLFTGSVKPEKRQELWDANRIIISTPQGMENDVISRKIKLGEVSLLIFDEAHRATGEYAYVFLAKKYAEVSKHERILALTASPGSDEEKITEVCNNLKIEEIEFRDKDSADVKDYVQVMNMRYVKVILTEEMKRVKVFLERCYDSKLSDATKLGYLQGDSSNYNKTTLLKIVGGLQGKIASGEKDYEILKTISLLAEALKIQHALELLETQDVGSVIKYLEGLKKQARTSKVKAVKNLVQDLNFRSALIVAKKLEEENINHPKLDKLKEIVYEETVDDKNKKIIIFTQYRDTASKIKQVLESINITSEIFVGQAKKKDTGLSQKQQKEMIERFERNKFTCLIATSVGEEGLDIPEVDLVIFYEPIPSAIRTVQRRGRTGRQKEGKVITLITKDSRDEGYRWSAYHKEKRMYRVLKKIKGRMQPAKKETKTLDEFYEAKEESDIVVKVDYREKGSQVLRELLEQNVNIDLTNLQVGDYLLSKDVVIEFKTIRDFVDSILDGRLLNQARELKQYSKPLIVIEGTDDMYSQRRIHPNAIRGMIAALTISLKIPVFQTKNARDTAGLIRVIAKREQDPNNKDFQMHSAKPMSDSEIQEYIISAIPGVGARLAPLLLKHFGSIKNIINATEKELKEVELIGPIKAKRIKELIDKKYEE